MTFARLREIQLSFKARNACELQALHHPSRPFHPHFDAMDNNRAFWSPIKAVLHALPHLLSGFAVAAIVFIAVFAMEAEGDSSPGKSCDIGYHAGDYCYIVSCFSLMTAETPHLRAVEQGRRQDHGKFPHL